jgi:glutamine amidotransferase
MIIIVDYGVGNLGSIVNMFKKIGVKAASSSNAAEIEAAEKLILPGVGAFDPGMEKLEERGLVPLLNRLVLEEKRPVLGLCLGLQLMTEGSAEGRLPGLGWLAAETVRFQFGPEHSALKVPHMGWNTLESRREHPLFKDLEQDARFYFVHSYYVRCRKPEMVLGGQYGIRIHSVLGSGNIWGAQFHPEKSHRFGMRLLRNFAEQVS